MLKASTQIGDFGFPVEVVRSGRRKTYSVHLEGEAVVARVPNTFSDNQVREIIRKHLYWITKNRKKKTEQPEAKPKEYVNGERFMYLGRDHTLEVIRGDSPYVSLVNGSIQVTVSWNDENPNATVRAFLEVWFREQAEQVLNEKTDRWAKVVGVEPKSVIVKDYKSRWGACTSTADITYNWRIISAPERIVDYVVVHELCHILEHNHSPRFWNHVGKHMPDYMERKKWLRDNTIEII